MNKQEKVVAAIARTQTALSKLGYAPIEVKNVMVTKLRKGVAGLAHTFTNEIRISVDYLNEFEEEVLGRTVPHEVVHLYVSKYFPYAKQAHGPEFRRLMRSIGVDDSTRHSMQLKNETSRKVTVSRYVYATPSGKELKVTAQMHSKIQRRPDSFHTKDTKEKIQFTGKVEKIAR